ncbi:MAG: maltose alpha-D-glucosyltransferase [Chloroflexota bacterium]|nr:maltose alpha-D-glucosyltransferase [Chloroflexota bacterium]
MTIDQPLWYKDAIIYEVYVRAFNDSNSDGHGDIKGLTQRLDYLQDLGVTCLWLLPIYPSPLKDDGYDIANYYDVHPTYGTLDDLKELVDAAHARGLRIIADLVLNHTSDQHPWFRAARSNRRSIFRDYYVWSESSLRYRDARIIFTDTEESNWAWDPVSEQYYWHRFYSSQPDLNYENPMVQEEMIKIMSFWLDLGVDGFRADAVPYLFESEGTNCENLPQTHAFLKQIRQYINEHYPGRILLAEANQWPEDILPYFGEGDDEFHMGFHFPIMPRIFMALRKGDRTPLAWILSRTPFLRETNQWGIFLRNHDELTLEMVTEEERQWMRENYAPEPRMRLNVGIRRRLSPLLDNDRRKIELAYSLLFTFPGSPILYYGDEIGMGDNIWLPDRNGVRTPMQWNAEEENAGFSEAPVQTLYIPVIDDEVYGPRRVNVESQRADPGSLWNVIRQMIAVRKQHRVFGWGEFEWLDFENLAIAAFQRTHQGESILAIHNLSDAAQTLSYAMPEPVTSMTDLLSGKEFVPANENLEIELQPYEYLWLRK